MKTLLINGLAQLDFSQQRLIMLCLAVVIGAAGVSYVVVPAYQTYQASAEQIAALRHQVNAGAIPTVELQRLHQEIADLQAQLDKNRIGNNPRQAEAALLAKLHDSTQAQNLQLLKVAPRQQPSQEGIQQLKFELEVQGTYQDTATWIEWLDASGGPTQLLTFEMGSTQTGNANERGLLHTKVAIVAYQWAAS